MIPGYQRLFGGQLLAQGLLAALAAPAVVAAAPAEAASAAAPAGEWVSAATPAWAPRSVHMVFVAEGRPDAAVEWTTEVVRAGRTFTTVSVRAEQGERVLATALVSLHRPDRHGFAHASPAPAVAPPPALHAVPPAGAVPCEMRVDGDVRLDAGEIGPPELGVWMRPPRAVAGGPPWCSEALLAYCSDATMMTAALRPHGMAIGSPALAATSVTSHTVSFHRPFAFDDWMLFAQESPAAAGGRAYVRGDWFGSDGLLVASCAQEVLVRPAPAGAGSA